MTIGEALKKEQEELGLTETEMVENIITTSAYSRIVNNKRRISSDLLLEILLMHDIDLENFLFKIKDTYSCEKIRLEQNLSQKMTVAINTHNKNEAKVCYKQIIKSNVSSNLKLRAEIAMAYINDSINELDESFKKVVINNLTKTENWFFNINTLSLFSTAIIILPEDFVEIMMNSFFKKVQRLDRISGAMNERFADICNNYLHWRYKNNKRFNKENNVENAIEFLDNLKNSPRFIIYRISARYYSALFSNKLNKAKKIKDELLDIKRILAAKNWPG